MWELDYKENWALKNRCFWTVVLDKIIESPLDSKQIQPVHSKGNQSWIFIGRADAEAEVPILWPLDSKSWLIGKDPDARKIWGQEDKEATEVVAALSHVWLFSTPWTAARQGFLSFTISWNLHKLMSIELVMPSIHLILCRPLLLLPPIPPSIWVFSNESH